jgi:hypothetical protein
VFVVVVVVATVRLQCEEGEDAEDE